jgi:alkylation response protein AidB-like acyl-CoA dehydrogenase
MDYTLTESQREVLGAVRPLLARHAGTQRAREVMSGAGVDMKLYSELKEFGVFSTDFAAEFGGHVLSVIIEEAVGAASILPVGTEVLLRSVLGLESLEAPITLTTSREESPVAFGAQAGTLLLIEDNTVSVVEDGYQIGTENRTFGIPVAPVAIPPHARTRTLEVDAQGLIGAWRLALAAEIAGAATAGLALTREHLTARKQFGRPLASLQAIQHRLADLHVRIEGTRWLARYAGWTGADPTASAIAATHAAETAKTAIWELQQLQGAIGFTKEYDLYLFTLRMHVLRLLLDGSRGGHAIEAAERKWGSAARTQHAVEAAP